jgi:hypothetical protein
LLFSALDTTTSTIVDRARHLAHRGLRVRPRDAAQARDVAAWSRRHIDCNWRSSSDDLQPTTGDSAMTKNISSDILESIDLGQLNTVVGGGFWDYVEDAARYTTGAASAVLTAPLAVGRGVSEFAGSMRQGHSFGDSVSSGIVQSMNTTGVLDRDSRGLIPQLSAIPANRR